MDDRGFIGRRGFWLLALLWLPAGVMATAVVRFGPEHGLPETGGMVPAMLPMTAGSLVWSRPAAYRWRWVAGGCGASVTGAASGGQASCSAR